MSVLQRRTQLILFQRNVRCWIRLKLNSSQKSKTVSELAQVHFSARSGTVYDCIKIVQKFLDVPCIDHQYLYFFFDGAVHYAKVSSILYGLMAPLLQTPILVPLQLELIQHYCDGCSANVDLSKFLHPLNRSIPRPRISDCYRLGWIFRSSTEHCI
ncbi:unnamed protein product [Albugo candida]|uniref:Uncharacterized protein n=1 Tax=Albugo candida TaxID=65357 RepID=A0A024GMY5_9STRA|nr:unnamed protein product [Albugo candida]|eukprot:CCI47879.1 unnamed protein product [Albugo candida]